MDYFFNALRKKNRGVFASLFVVIFQFSSLYAQSLEQIKTQDLEKRNQMLQISKELGVTCTDCHNIKNFKDNSKKTFKVAMDHLKVVELLKNMGFDGKKYSQSNCFFCHRGILNPNVIPPKGLNEPSLTFPEKPEKELPTEKQQEEE